MDTNAIVKQLIEERERIDAAIKLLSSAPATKARKPMSAAARKRIAAAQKARWAKQKGK